MPSQYLYQQTLHSVNLGVSKVIRAMTSHELDWLVEAQFAKWHEQEVRKRTQEQLKAQREAARRHGEDLKRRAEDDTRAAQADLDALRTILTGGLAVNLAVDWEQMLDRRRMPPFQFSDPKPERDRIRQQLLGSRPVEMLVASHAPEEPSFLEFFLPFLRRRRQEREAAASEAVREDKRRARAAGPTHQKFPRFRLTSPTERPCSLVSGTLPGIR
jgi:hypothetical protein